MKPFIATYKPCPFCGSEPERSDCIECGYIMIRCPECDAGISIVLPPRVGPDVIDKAEDELVSRWNRRVKLADLSDI